MHETVLTQLAAVAKHRSDQFAEMFNQMRDGISDSAEIAFSELIENYSFVADKSLGAANTRAKMKEMMNTVYDLADRVGDSAVST